MLKQFSPDVETALAARRFLAFVPRRGIGCWLWAGHVRKNGYGGFRVGKRSNTQAHRFAFVQSGGSLKPPRDAVHHACLNTSCVRPTHLEAVTRAEHDRKARLAKLLASAVSYRNTDADLSSLSARRT